MTQRIALAPFSSKAYGRSSDEDDRSADGGAQTPAPGSPSALLPARGIAAATPGRVRVATLNIWARNGDWRGRRAALLHGLTSLRPDVIALQETIVRDGYDQARDLLGAEYEVVHQRQRQPHDGMGVSIASRWPLAMLHELDLHVSARVGEFPATTLIAEVAAPAPIGRVVIANHFPSYEPSREHERELQSVAAARCLEELADGAHVVVAGDLDADPDAASIRFWTGRQSLGGTSVCYRDAWALANPARAGETHTPVNPLVAAPEWPFRRIDYLLVRAGRKGEPTLRVDSCELIFAAPIGDTWATDHFGVLAELSARATS